MRTLLIALCITAAPIPDNVRDYFERQEAAHTKKIEDTIQQIADFEIAIKGEPLARRKSILTANMHKTEDALAKLKKSKERPPLEFPSQPTVDMVGPLPTMTVHAVVDDDTVILKKNFLTVIANIPTKELKARTRFDSPDLWEITHIGNDTPAAQRYLPDISKIGGPVYTVRPLKALDIKRYRAAFDAE
jgi:hypothetical protein